MHVSDIGKLCGESNLLLWAGAGYGKGATLSSYLIPKLRKMYGSTGQFWISAPTGISAGLVNGSTIYSLSGIGTGAGDVESLYKRIMSVPSVLARWKKLLCLALDECSLLPLETWMKLEHLARLIKGNSKFFGGIRVILIGDFCQLPPCNDVTKGDSELLRVQARYLFEDQQLWMKGNFQVSVSQNIVMNMCLLPLHYWTCLVDLYSIHLLEKSNWLSIVGRIPGFVTMHCYWTRWHSYLDTTNDGVNGNGYGARSQGNCAIADV
jgi:hypothetical protein